MQDRRTFLHWDRHALPAAVTVLSDGYTHAGSLDLGDALIALPGARAARRGGRPPWAPARAAPDRHARLAAGIPVCADRATSGRGHQHPPLAPAAQDRTARGPRPPLPARAA